MKLHNKKLIIAIMSCKKNRDNHQIAIVSSWANQIPLDIAWFFFEGGERQFYSEEEHRLILECGDGYEDLAKKTHEMVKYCHENFNYDFLLKCDDDTLCAGANIYIRIDINESIFIYQTDF